MKYIISCCNRNEKVTAEGTRPSAVTYTLICVRVFYASAEALFFTRFAAIMKRAKNAAATMMPTG